VGLKIVWEFARLSGDSFAPLNGREWRRVDEQQLQLQFLMQFQLQTVASSSSDAVMQCSSVAVWRQQQLVPPWEPSVGRKWASEIIIFASQSHWALSCIFLAPIEWCHCGATARRLCATLVRHSATRWPKLIICSRK